MNMKDSKRRNLCIPGLPREQEVSPSSYGFFAQQKSIIFLFAEDFFIVLPLQTGGADSFHQIFLEEQENEDCREDRQRCHGKHCTVVRGGSGITEQLQCQRCRIFGGLVDIQQCRKEVIPSPHKGEDAASHNSRFHKRGNHQTENPEIRTPVNLRCLIQLPRNSPMKFDIR